MRLTYPDTGPQIYKPSVDFVFIYLPTNVDYAIVWLHSDTLLAEITTTTMHNTLTAYLVSTALQLACGRPSIQCPLQCV